MPVLHKAKMNNRREHAPDLVFRKKVNKSAGPNRSAQNAEPVQEDRKSEEDEMQVDVQALAERVYRMIKKDLLLERERR